MDTLNRLQNLLQSVETKLYYITQYEEELA